MKKLIAIDLFSGAGGFSEGIIKAGFHIIFSNDINETAAKTYIARHKELGFFDGNNTKFIIDNIKNINKELIFNEISKLKSPIYKDISEIDVIFGGPPCQGFSRAGKRMHDDPRNYLFKEYIRIVDEIRPKYVVMENVEGFIDTKLKNFKSITGKIFDGIHKLPELLEKEFKSIKYNLLPLKILNAADFGVPQVRKRAIFIAYRNGETKPEYPIPTVYEYNTVKDALSDLYNVNKNLSNYIIDLNSDIKKPIKKMENFEYLNHTKVVIERFELYKNGETTAQLRKRIKSNGIDISKKIEIIRYLKVKLPKLSQRDIINLYKKNNIDNQYIDLLLTKKINRIKLNPDLPAPTMLTLPDDFISPYSNKALTVREMARLQSFPDDFKFLGKKTTGGSKRKIDVPQYTQVGNAVPPLLAYNIAKKIKEALEQ